jgi:hypothetical protein
MTIHLTNHMRLFNIIALLAVICIISSVASAGGIVVQAIDKNGKALMGGQVYLDGKIKGGIPYGERTLYLRNVPAGQHVVKFHYCPFIPGQCHAPKQTVFVEDANDVAYCMFTINVENQP